MKHKQEEVNTYCTTTIRNIISAQAIRAQHTAICCFWNNTVYTVTLLVSLHVRLCGLSTYIYFSCLFGPWRTSMLSRSSWCPCPFRLSFQRLTFLKLTGLSSSIQNPAKWQSSFFFFIAIHEARWTEVPVTFLSVRMESARPLLNSSDGDS